MDEHTWENDRGGHLWPKDHEAVASDGVRVRYTVLGREHRATPPIVLCAGYVCPDTYWRSLAEDLADRHRVVVLNYRGIGASTSPDRSGRRRRDRAEDFRIERLAEDVAAVCDAEAVTAAVVIGHSMGCQVAFALWRARPDLVAGLVLVTGPYASPLRTFYGRDLGARLFPLAYAAAPLIPTVVRRLAMQTPRLPVAMPVARALRALGPYTPDEAMVGYFRHLGELDPEAMLQVARGMHEFDAGPWLSEVDVPTLILTGGADPWTPPEVGEGMASTMPDAELAIVEDGTHGALIEFPDEIADTVADFLHRRLGAPSRPRRGAPGRIVPATPLPD
ncbi:alpha/beta fold hydrolase [Egicoccus halophilus]|uniref:Alpha/beta hydrolase n=1 Tax=Egicoccus halophilus TaxID=1670830 RepID=A0A8J3AH14_9ACTN|nr:alpha/beta hydrolase [Egicoccus halophilus]GGI08965.1 alpha/beta hydrolase [Egicoccus halophilus]